MHSGKSIIYYNIKMKVITTRIKFSIQSFIKNLALNNILCMRNKLRRYFNFIMFLNRDYAISFCSVLRFECKGNYNFN